MVIIIKRDFSYLVLILLNKIYLVKFAHTLQGGSMYTKWYFEIFIDQLETISHQKASIRIGWGNTDGYTPHPVGGPGWGGISLGDDFYSFAFDGENLWTGGKKKFVSMPPKGNAENTAPTASNTGTTGSKTGTIGVDHSPESINLKRGDVIGCLLDLTGPVIQFNLNGTLVKGYFQVGWLNYLYIFSLNLPLFVLKITISFIPA